VSLRIGNHALIGALAKDALNLSGGLSVRRLATEFGRQRFPDGRRPHSRTLNATTVKAVISPKATAPAAKKAR
jgi:hypothetical protein